MHRFANRSSSTPTGAVRRLIVVMLLAAVVAGGLIAVSMSGRLDVLEVLEPRLEARVATVSVETGLAADATVVATGYVESRPRQ